VQMKNIRSFKIIGLVLLALLLVVSCAKKGEKPNANLPPDTFIKTFVFATSPSSADKYLTTIYFDGKDPDGRIVESMWQIIGDQGDSVIDNGVNISNWQTTTTLDITVNLSFPTFQKTYTINIKAVDSKGVEDPTPATDIIAKDRIAGINYPPNTGVIGGPINGAITGSGVQFVVRGYDIDGVMDSVDYKIDTASTWTRVGADLVSGTATLDVLDLPLGINTLLFRARDNFGAIDPTPTSVTFIVTDTLTPYLIITSGALPGSFYFLPQGGTTTDLATGWFGDATWYFSTLTYRVAVDDTTSWSEWAPDPEITLTGLEAGAHTFYLEARDLGNNITLQTAGFGIGQLVGGRGILVVNGIDWANYASSARAMYSAHAPWGTLTDVDYWDLFEGASGSYPAILDSIGIKGEGPVSGDTLAFYSTMVMLLNNFNGDLAVFDGMRPLISTYLKAGGNIVMGARFGESFIGTSGDLFDYTHIVFNQVGINIPGGLVAAVSGLVDQAPTGGQTFTDLPAIPTHNNITVLFTTPDFPNSVGGLILQPEAGGKFAFIAGRAYRYDNAAMATNYDYILTHYMGE